MNHFMSPLGVASHRDEMRRYLIIGGLNFLSCRVLLVVVTVSISLVVWHTDAVAQPTALHVGACLSVRISPPPRNTGHKQATLNYINNTINQLKDIAAAIRPKDGTPLEIDYIVLSGKEPFPAPRDCEQAGQNNTKYDIWLELIYDQDSTFLFEVSQRDGQDLTVIASNPDPAAGVTKTKSLLAEVGRKIVAKQPSVAEAIPVEAVSHPQGLIFVYDDSGSMYNTDPGARSRLEVSQTIGEILAHNARNVLRPTPFAMVVFSDAAKALEDFPGSKWFLTTPGGLAHAHDILAKTISGWGRTNISAAFVEVGNLIKSRTDIERWHVVFFTDGVPTIGVTDYDEIARIVRSALGGKSTLSIVALHDKDPRHTAGAKLTELVRATLDGTGQPGEIINLTVGDGVKRFQGDLERIAFLIEGATVRDKVDLICTHDRAAGTARCEVDRKHDHALRFGAAQKVTFIANTEGLPSGTCTVTVENPGLGLKSRTVQLADGQQSAVLDDASFRIALMRGNARISITVEMKNGRLNGDWLMSLEMNASKEHGS